MRPSSSILALATVSTVYGPFAAVAVMKYLDDLDQVIKYTGAWNFRTETNALNGGYSLSKDPSAAVSVVYSFRSVDFWSPLWPAPIQLVISVGARATIVDLQDHDVPEVPLPTDVPPRSTKASRIVWSYKGLVQQQYTINVRAASSGVTPAYVVVDTFGFDLEDPPSTSSTTDTPVPSPTTSSPQTATPTSAPNTSSTSSGSSTSPSSLLSTSSSGTSTPSLSSNTVSASDSSLTLPYLIPTIQPTVIQGNGGTNPNPECSRNNTNTGLIAGLSVAGCVLEKV